ncbi:MFS transporter [Kitasatospora sp. NPDC008115]|uniref:MFS transporter n=1 Tax=Kitasatospora sp. NPDC008115 TaxID=3364022 RepID=UPI0036E31B98
MDYERSVAPVDVPVGKAAGPAAATEASGAKREHHPEKLVSAGFQASLFLAFLGMWTALLPATGITLALRVNQIDPDGKAASLSLVLGVGAFVALVAQNLFGALSDRTTSRFGMRKPWIASGMVTGAASLLLLASADSIPLLVLAWALTQLTFNALIAGLNPVIPDQVPKRQLGRVSGLMGITQVLAGVGGAFLAQLFLPNLTAAMLIPGLFMLVFVTVFLRVLKDRRAERADLPPFSLLTLLKAFWTSPREAPDFALAWISRLMVMFGNMTLTNYQLFFLLDRFDYTEDTVGPAVLLLTVINAVTAIPTSIVFGRISDRLGRRKIFVLVSAVVLSVAHIVAGFAPNFATFVASSVIAGFAMGAYLSVDQALVAEVLPSRTDVAKDMAVLHLANVLPQTLVPVTAPLFLMIGGGSSNYAALFLGGAVIAIVGAVANQFIRSVR